MIRFIPFLPLGFGLGWLTKDCSPLAVMAVAGVFFLAWLGLAIALRAPSPLGLRPEPVPVSAIRRVSTIAKKES